VFLASLDEFKEKVDRNRRQEIAELLKLLLLAK
jgi:hypothetical protein